MKTMRRWTGLIAALLILLMGILWVLGRGTVATSVGLAFILVGGGAALWQIRSLRATQEDPYDLKRLFDPPPTIDEPEEDFLDDESVPFCHHCGSAVSGPFARCPECGNRL